MLSSFSPTAFAFFACSMKISFSFSFARKTFVVVQAAFWVAFKFVWLLVFVVVIAGILYMAQQSVAIPPPLQKKVCLHFERGERTLEKERESFLAAAAAFCHINSRHLAGGGGEDCRALPTPKSSSLFSTFSFASFFFLAAQLFWPLLCACMRVYVLPLHQLPKLLATRELLTFLMWHVPLERRIDAYCEVLKAASINLPERMAQTAPRCKSSKPQLSLSLLSFFFFFLSCLGQRT